MPSRKLTVEEKIKNKIDRDTAVYMEGVREFLRKANNGDIPLEYNLSLLMLEEYYKQLLVFNAEVAKLDGDYVVQTRYGLQPNAILKARDMTVQKLDMIQKQLGLTFNSQIKLKLKDTKPVEESPLEKLMKSQGNMEVR
jgi:hypothetical protein